MFVDKQEKQSIEGLRWRFGLEALGEHGLNI